MMISVTLDVGVYVRAQTLQDPKALDQLTAGGI